MPNRLHMTAGDGHLSEEQVALYVDALLLKKTSELPPPLLDHVEECLSCKQGITDTFRLVSSSGIQSQGPHPSLGRLPRSRAGDRVGWLRAAAALAVVTGVGLLVAYLAFWRGETGHESAIRSQPPSETPATPPRGEEQMAPKGTLLASSYAENPELESLAADPARSEAGVILSPPDGALVPGRVTFAWRTGVAPPYSVVIMDNRGRTVQTGTTVEPRFAAAGTLPPGLYYWKVVGSEELILAGKFRTR